MVDFFHVGGKMKFEFVDYSKLYYTKIAKIVVPAKRGGKFIQVINHELEKEYIVLSPKELSVFHANIFERFCMLQGESGGSYNSKRDFFEINDGSLEIVGGGMWSIDDESKTVSFFGASQMYGKYNSEGLKMKLKNRAGIAGYEIRIEGV